MNKQKFIDADHNMVVTRGEEGGGGGEGSRESNIYGDGRRIDSG